MINGRDYWDENLVQISLGWEKIFNNKVYSSEDDYEIVKELGNGTFSTVFLAKRKTDGKKVALKALYTRS